MKYTVAIFCAVVAVAIAHETATLDETTDLIQEQAMVTAGAKTQAKVSTNEAVSVKAASKAGSKTRATVMIGTHELDAEAVSMAKHALKKVTMKLGARHPVFLGEAAGIADFASSKAQYVKGGYDKLKTILIKVDEFERELEIEKQNAVDKREEQYVNCDVGGRDFNKAQEKREEDRDARKNAQTKRFAKINDLHIKISEDLSSETDYATSIRKDIEQVDTEYKNYWAKTEERHQVRNVLMQALWLVCTGFATFRHTTYCTNIRQQPDFDEPSENPPVVGDMTSGQQQRDLATRIAHSKNFGATMQPVWEQQKVADASAVNSLDGDVDMEKGFVNNRAPWGVDPEGMSSRAGAPKEETLGESNEEGAHDMTSEELSSRLGFLISSSSVPERISVPITAFIQALSTDDAAVQGGLVEALVKMDTEEGKSQSDMDYGWYNTMVEKRSVMYENLQGGQKKKFHGLELFEEIERIHAKMKSEQEEEVKAHDQFVADTKVQGQAAKVCDEKIIELEALIEVCNEELTNIQRLNSLLRYLVVGDEAKCPAEKGFICNEGEGSCTWRNRGAGKNADSDTSCETETGQDIPCDYTGSLHQEDPDFPTNGEGSKFCACEYGFFGKNGNDKQCNKKTCPGFGRIRYPGNELMALQFENQPIKYTKGNGFAVTKYKPLAVCSGIRLEEHGTCDDDEGKCVQCWLKNSGKKEDITPELNREHGLVVVPTSVVTPMPFNGEKLKCEEWLVPQKKAGAVYRYTTEQDPTLCSGRGSVVTNFMGYVDGRCSCKEQYYGTSCELYKCQMNSDEGPWYERASPVACNGRGTCMDETDGSCDCEDMATGKYCENKRCPGYDANEATGKITDPECGKGVGVCNFAGGRCQCADGASCGINGQPLCPGACIYADCQANCQSQSTDGGTQIGLCDRFSGLCMCNPETVYNGPACETPGRGVEQQGDKQEMLWTETMDKWGWSTCNDGYLLVGMKTDQMGTKDALYNLDRGICQRPFEAHTPITRAVENYRCYHENWWKKFDTRGGKFCRRNYFVAGLFRSHCNSLYCIEMAKCCSVKRSLWTNCKWVNTKEWTGNANGMMVSGDQGFIVGFFRNKLHTLAGITNLRQCTPIWYGQLFKYKTRFDN